MSLSVWIGMQWTEFGPPASWSSLVGPALVLLGAGLIGRISAEQAPATSPTPTEPREPVLPRVALLIGLVPLALMGMLWRLQYLAGFYADDWVWLECARTSLTHPHHIFNREISGSFRPVSHALFALEYALWGMRPLGYILTSWGLHLCNVALGYGVLRRLGFPAAWRAAVVLITIVPSWGVEALVWISAQANAILGLLSVAVADQLLRHRETGAPRSALLAGLGMVLMLGTKEEAAVVVALITGALLLTPSKSSRAVGVALVGVVAWYFLAQYEFHHKFTLMKRGLWEIDWYLPLAVVTTVLKLLERNSGMQNSLGLLALVALSWRELRGALPRQQMLRRLCLAALVIAGAFAAMPTGLGALAVVNPGTRYAYLPLLFLAPVAVALWGLALRRLLKSSHAADLAVLVLTLVMINGGMYGLQGMAHWQEQARKEQAWQAEMGPVETNLAQIPAGARVWSVDAPISEQHLQSYWRLRYPRASELRLKWGTPQYRPGDWLIQRDGSVTQVD